MLSVLLNNTLQPAPPSTNQTKELSTLHAPKPTGGYLDDGGRPKRVATEKNIFRKK